MLVGADGRNKEHIYDFGKRCNIFAGIFASCFLSLGKLSFTHAPEAPEQPAMK